MKSRTKLTCFRCSTLIGCFLLLFPNALPWYWGNLSVYTDSYIRATLGQNADPGPPWTISFYVMFFSVGVFASDLIAQRFGNRWAVVIAIVLYSLVLLSSYLAIQASGLALSAVLGIGGGIIAGVIYSRGIVYAMLCSTKYVGLFTGLVTSGCQSGSLLVNQFVTFYINPYNDSPDLVLGPNAYFTQRDILNRVPSMFLVFGAVAPAWHVICLLLIRDLPKEIENKKNNVMTPVLLSGPNNGKMDQENLERNSESEGESSHLISSASWPNGYPHNSDSYIEASPPESVLCHYQNVTSQCSVSQEEMKKECNDLRKSRMDGQTCSSTVYTGNENETLDNDRNSDTNKEEISRSESTETCDEGVRTDFTTLQMLKTGNFYIMWICNFIADFSFIVMTNSYKKFGQHWIKDDYFLTNVGVLTAIAAAFMRVWWGAMVDKFGVKNTFITFLASLSITSLYWYFTPMISKWLFMFWTALFGSLNSGLYVVFSVGTLKMYGKSHYAKNYAALLTAGIVLNFTGPPAIQTILNNFGWYGVFCTNGVVLALAVILVILCLPRI